MKTRILPLLAAMLLLGSCGSSGSALNASNAPDYFSPISPAYGVTEAADKTYSGYVRINWTKFEPTAETKGEGTCTLTPVWARSGTSYSYPPTGDPISGVKIVITFVAQVGDQASYMKGVFSGVSITVPSDNSIGSLNVSNVVYTSFSGNLQDGQ
ncbi:MAG: hypothetical protein BWY98_00573 [Tenericutes bacterium ADurb.BinA155]|nr:MAG: hypothetical protein BWY98_00573 [Tenericutes bacterium ADurb.BinA155]